MKVLVEITDILSEPEIRSELRDYKLFPDTALGSLTCRIIGEVTEIHQHDGYGGIRKSYHLEEL